MPAAKAQLVLLAALASAAATGALAKPRAARPAPRAEAAVEAPATRLAFVSAPRRAEAPALVLRPEFSEGEWTEQGGEGRLDAAALQNASAPVESEVGRATTVRAGSNLAKIGERTTQGAPVPTSRLDQPMSEMPGPAVTFGGIDLGSLNLRRAD